MAEVGSLSGEAETQALARARSDLSTIASAASHDLKSPLQAISGFAHLLEQLYSPALDERGHMFTRTIIDGVNRMASFIDGLAYYCQVASTPPRAEAVRLEDVLSGVLQKLGGAINASGASITAGSLPEIVGDPAQTAVVLTNLLSNALTWVEQGTVPKIAISATSIPDGWSIAVEDNGVGIDAEHVERVFGLFGRLPSSAGTVGGGTGLALAKRIVEGWGGTIRIEQAASGGSRFCFTIPCGTGIARDAPSQAPVVAEAGGPTRHRPGPVTVDLPEVVQDDQGEGLAGDRQRLLLVEDSEPHARLVVATLAEAPGRRYRLRHVVDLRHARSALAEEQIDCILLDLSLPDGEGLDSLAQVRAMAPSIPVVVLTSRSDEALAVTAVQKGAQDYLVKGAMEPTTLGRSIRYAIERKALEAQLAQQALHDSLTGLPNRALLLDRLNPALARAGRTGEKIALLYLDLDGFKPINDDLGHEAGDGILVEVARRLTSVVRPHDTVSRIGGDEFAVLCEGFRGDAEITSLARRMAEAIAQPISVGNEKRSVRASIGIAFAGGPGERADDLIRAADQDMYREKRRAADPSSS